MSGQLTDHAIRAAKATEKLSKLWDGDGLYLQIAPPSPRRPEGAKRWRFRYTVDGHEKLLALGVYPHVSLKRAREKRDEARKLLGNELDPAAERRKAKLANVSTFEAVAAEYLDKQADRLASITLGKAKWQLREFINPVIGSRPIAEILAPDILAPLRKLEARGHIETAHKTLELCGRVFRYGIATGRCTRDVAHDLRGALKPRSVENLAAITEPARVGELLRALDDYTGQPATRAALLLAPHVFLRPGELRAGKWDEVDFEAAQWRIPAARMKMRRDHIVPLSRQSRAILKDLHELTGRSDFMFPAIGPRPRPLSENTIGAALRAIGYASDVMTPHGFRSMASTLLHELGFVSSDIELQLAHADKNKIRAVYNRSERIKERTRMMQKWSDYLDTLRADKKVKRTAAA